MPRGDGQKGKRRGKYKARETGGKVIELRADLPPVDFVPPPPPRVDAPPPPRRVTVDVGTKTEAEALEFELPHWWSDEDEAHFVACMRDSRVKKISEREHGARTATALKRQITELDMRPRSVEEEKALISAASQYRKYRFEVLGVAEKSDDDDDDDPFGGADDEDDE